MDSSDIPLEVVPRLSSYNMQNKNTYDDIGSKDANPFINLDLNYKIGRASCRERV